MTTTGLHQHPLAQLVAARGWTHESYLRRVAAEQARRGYGTMSTERGRFSRWTRPVRPATPKPHTQLAMAAVLGIPAREVHTRGWPAWLLLALHDNHTVWESPWTPAGTISALDYAGRPDAMDRRGFLTTTGSTLAAVLAQWATADPGSAAGTPTGRRIGTDVADEIDTRLGALRRLDDTLGADHVYDSALAELRLITRLLRDSSPTEATGRRLHSCAAEAARLAGWCSYDTGDLGAAETHFATALRAAATAGDRTAGAIAAGFWANVRYSAPTPDPHGALALVNAALGQRAGITSPRVLTMLHIRGARAHSVAGQATAAYRAVDAALTAYDDAAPAHEDLPTVYWITAGEVFQAAGSAALTLGDPARALEFFAAATGHHDPYNATYEPRGAAIYLARQSCAYAALGDLDGAVETARQAVGLMGGVNSARGTSTLTQLHAELAAHESAPVVAGFLAETR